MSTIANNEELIQLIQAGVDGELTAKQQHQFDELMASSKDARELKDELSLVTEELSKAPEIEIPEFVSRRILNSLEATTVKNTAAKSTRRWWWRSQPMPNFVLASLLIAFVAVGLFQIDTGSLNDPLKKSEQQLTGTLVDRSKNNSDQLNKKVLVDRLRIIEDQINGSIQLETSGNKIDLTIDLNSNAPLQAKVLIEDGQYIYLDNTGGTEESESAGSIFRDSSYIKAVGEDQISQTLRFESLNFQKNSNLKTISYQPLIVELYRKGELVRTLSLATHASKGENF